MDRCVIVATGGTIASKSRQGSGYSPQMTGEEVRALLPAQEFSGIDIEVDNFSSILSQAMTPADMLRLSERVRHHVSDPGVRAVVVTHGTVVMEESAFLCDLLLSQPKPVIFTGAMIPVNQPDTDGPKNLENSMRLALSPDAGALGVVVCMNGEVHAARWVRKLHASSPDSFHSPNGAVLGRVNQVFSRESRLPPRGTAFQTDALEPKVDLISLASGMDDRFVACAEALDTKALVIEGLPGMGAVTPLVAAALPRLLAKGVIVVLASRSPFGSVRPSSGGSGGSYTLNEMGVLMGGSLSAHKIRLLLMAALAQGLNRDQIAALIAEFGSTEVRGL